MDSYRCFGAVRRAWCAWWRASLLLALVLGGTRVMAEPSGAEKETARSLMDEGDRLTAASDHQGALKRYQAAHQIMGVPTTGIEVARSQTKLGRLVEARATAIAVANLPAAAGEPSVFGDARVAAAQLAESLEARIPSLIFEVQPTQVQAAVTIGAVAVPPAAFGLPFKVNPGTHAVSVAAPGYVSQEFNIDVAEGEQRRLSMVLQADPAAVGPAPAEPAALTPAARTTTSQNQMQDTTSLSVDPQGSGGATTRGVVALGVAGAAVLVGGGAGIYSLLKTNEAKDNYCTGTRCSSAAGPLLDEARTSAWVANIGLGVAVLAAGYGMYELLFNADSGDAEATVSNATYAPVQVVVSPRGTGGSVLWSGAF